MVRRLSIRHLVSRVVGVALVLVGATGLTAARADAQTAKVPIILSVQAAAGDDQIVIRGTNLPATMPRVTLEGVQLQLITWNASQITAVLPGVAPGSYLLTVHGSAWYQVAVFIATIGAVGPPGPTGNDGPSGSEGVAGADGAAGPAGPAGAAGPAGPKGDTGNTGAAAEKGDKGETGTAGPAGAQGPAGVQGAMGPIGPQGMVGALGPQGPAGPQGAAGSGSGGAPSGSYVLGNAGDTTLIGAGFTEIGASGIDLWRPLSLTGVPSLRSGHTAVWTGSMMIVWGGSGPANEGAGQQTLNTGSRYDPVTDTWQATSLIGAPAARAEHTAVWTGTLMIVWGGGNPTLNDGGRYDPVADSWLPTNTSGAPTARSNNTAVWTGQKMMVWGGGTKLLGSNTGGQYDPSTDSWTPTSLVGATPIGVHTSVWTGSRMIVWGEKTGSTLVSRGHQYDPAADAWTVVRETGAPSARAKSTAVWTGTQMIVFGGRISTSLDDPGDALASGGQYDPVRDMWTATSIAGSPAMGGHTALWTGSEMIVWGGWNPYSANEVAGARMKPISVYVKN